MGGRVGVGRGVTCRALRFDLQSHSRCSDGALAAEDVVMRAAEAGLDLMALTDHDTVEGVAAARAAGRVHGIAVSAATEISAVDVAYEDFHILGYEIDTGDADLLAALEDFRADRGRRVLAMADRLRELGWQLDEAGLERIVASGRPLGRPHLADALLTHAGNGARLREEGIADRNDLFPRYLVPGAPAYVRRSRPTVGEAIDLVHRAGGVAVWAHPFWDVERHDLALETANRFADAGLDGVECFYATHDEAQTRLLHDLCTRRGLLITGSADFHGPDHERFSRFGAFETYGLEPVLGPIGAGAR